MTGVTTFVVAAAEGPQAQRVFTAGTDLVEVLATADLAADHAGYSRMVDLSLAGLTPGAYELAIAAKSKSGRTVSQRIPFNLR